MMSPRSLLESLRDAYFSPRSPAGLLLVELKRPVHRWQLSTLTEVRNACHYRWNHFEWRDREHSGYEDTRDPAAGAIRLKLGKIDLSWAQSAFSEKRLNLNVAAVPALTDPEMEGPRQWRQYPVVGPASRIRAGVLADHAGTAAIALPRRLALQAASMDGRDREALAVDVAKRIRPTDSEGKSFWTTGTAKLSQGGRRIDAELELNLYPPVYRRTQVGEVTSHVPVGLEFFRRSDSVSDTLAERDEVVYESMSSSYLAFMNYLDALIDRERNKREAPKVYYSVRPAPPALIIDGRRYSLGDGQHAYMATLLELCSSDPSRFFSDPLLQEAVIAGIDSERFPRFSQHEGNRLGLRMNDVFKARRPWIRIVEKGESTMKGEGRIFKESGYRIKKEYRTPAPSKIPSID